jgi:hypothetical protein
MNKGGRKRFGLFTSEPEPFEAGRHQLLQTSIPVVGQVWIPGRQDQARGKSSTPRQFSKSLFQKATLTLCSFEYTALLSGQTIQAW